MPGPCIAQVGALLNQATHSAVLGRGVVDAVDGGAVTVAGLTMRAVDNGSTVEAGAVVWFIREGNTSVVLGPQVE